jgi:hypothetical protein
METPFVVWRLKGWPGKFTIMELGSDHQTGLSPHAGAFTNEEMRQHLAKRGVLAPQIEIEMRKAQEAPEFNAPPYIVA